MVISLKSLISPERMLSQGREVWSYYPRRAVPDYQGKEDVLRVRAILILVILLVIPPVKILEKGKEVGSPKESY